VAVGIAEEAAHLPRGVHRPRDEACTARLEHLVGRAAVWHANGPLADLSKLIGQHLGVFPAPIDYQLVEGAGSFTVGDKVHTSMTPYKSLYGTTTTLHDSIFSTIPGSPAWISKAIETRVNLPEYGMTWSVKNRNAIQGEFKFEA
jgi:hypothetical protein